MHAIIIDDTRLQMRKDDMWCGVVLWEGKDVCHTVESVGVRLAQVCFIS